MQTAENNQGSKYGRGTLILLLLVFIAPLILAYIFHKNKNLLPSQGKNYGQLITPARPVPELELQTLSGERFTLEQMRHKWSYLYIIDNQCDDDCQLNLLKTKNARLGQGGEARRVNYYLILTKQPNAELLAGFEKEHPKMTILRAVDAQQRAFLNFFKVTDNQPVTAAQRVYVLDPIGNYIMYYEHGFEAIGIMEDLKHFLHSSQIG